MDYFLKSRMTSFSHCHQPVYSGNLGITDVLRSPADVQYGLALLCVYTWVGIKRVNYIKTVERKMQEENVDSKAIAIVFKKNVLFDVFTRQ